MATHSVLAHLCSWVYYLLFFCCLFPSQFDLRKVGDIHFLFFFKAFNSDLWMETMRAIHLFCVSQLTKMLIPFKLPLIFFPKYKVNRNLGGCFLASRAVISLSTFGFACFLNVDNYLSVLQIFSLGPGGLSFID